MSETKNLKLFKHDEPLETNENKFNIDLALNQNWDKIEEFADMVNDKIIEIEDKDEEQDFNLQELQNEIKKDRENMINLEVEGQSIHIEDSSDLEGKLEVLGNVEQNVREGYNLFNVKNISNKFITDNGVEQANEDWVLSDFIEVEEFTDYLLGWTSTSPVFQARIILYNKDKSFMQVLNFFYENMYKKTFRTIQNCKYVRISYSTSVRRQEVKRKNVQLVKGTTEKSYEQYGASPSPEYPSTVRAVGDNINLLKNTAKTQTVNGVTFTANEDGTVIANGTATSLAQISLVANLKLSAGTYTIKDAKAYVESTEFNDWFDGLNNPSTLTFNTEVLLKNVYIQVKQGETVNNKIFYPKLEKGTVPTSYSPYGQGSVEIKKQNKNLAPNLKDGKLEKQNTFICNCKKGESFTLSTKGTAEKDGRLFLRTNTDFAEGTDSYAEQKEITLNGTEQKITITSTIDGFLYIRTGGAAHVYNFTYLQIEKGTVKTEYTEHQEQTKILPIQKPMLEGDYFNRTDNKEVHTWKKIVLDGVNNKVTQTTTNQSGKYRYQYIDKDLKNCSLSEEKAYCTHLQLIEKNKTYDKMVGFTVSNGALLIYTDGDTAVNFNTKLQKENYIFYIPVIESAYEKIDLTLEQTKVLDELDNFPTYKPVTNITTDSIAKIKLKYIADTKTYVDNKTSNLEQQVSVINQLLSTTKTSSVLLDNLQSDIESEVL